MALLVLLTVGATIGWIASVLLQRDNLRESLRNIATGSVGSLASYVFATDKVALDSLTASSVALGALGAMFLLGFSLIIRRSFAG